VSVAGPAGETRFGDVGDGVRRARRIGIECKFPAPFTQTLPSLYLYNFVTPRVLRQFQIRRPEPDCNTIRKDKSRNGVPFSTQNAPGNSSTVTTGRTLKKKKQRFKKWE